MQTLVNVGIGVYYHLNKAYIAQKFCENRSNPSMHCNGHCFLSKQLKKAEDKEQKQAQSILKEKEEVVPNRFEVIPATYFPSFVAISSYHNVISVHSFTVATSLLKPPVV